MLASEAIDTHASMRTSPYLRPEELSSERNLENSSSAAILEFVVAEATWSITGQSTPGSGPSAFAVPYRCELATWVTNSSDRQRPRALAHFSQT